MSRGTVVSIVGARPQFIKLAPICRAFAARAGDWNHRIIHTGQHYDHDMSGVFFDELGIPEPDINLNIGSGPHGRQTAHMIAELESQFSSLQPDAVIVYGDTNSTLAGSIAASKMHLPLFHVEAGLRSFDRRMPEEVNRVLSDHSADVLFAPTERAMRNLHREGLEARAVKVGDVMYDAVLFNAALADKMSTRTLEELNVQAGAYVLVTVHRAATTEPADLTAVLATVDRIAGEILPVVFPVHPRTRAAAGEFRPSDPARLIVTGPKPYLEMLALVRHARLVLTDSGGLQKEAAFLGTPCITLRTSTEWTETVEIGANRLVGTSPPDIFTAVSAVAGGQREDWSRTLAEQYGDGDAAARIVGQVVQWLDTARCGGQTL